ncbi:nucleotidyltransferase family protein [Nautilia sp.]
MLNRQKVLNLLKKNKKYLQKNFGVKEILLVGSYARNEPTSSSDIDIVVDMPSDFDKFFELKQYLEKNLKLPVDLAIKTSLRHYIKKEIQKDAIYV